MARKSIGAAMLPVLALAAGLAAAPVAAEPMRLDPEALDAVVAGAGKRVGARAVVKPTANGGLALLSLALVQPQLVGLPQTTGSGSTGGGKKSISLSGKKTFKADRVTKPHTESLVVSGAVGG